jgi:hypothetical protein
MPSTVGLRSNAALRPRRVASAWLSLVAVAVPVVALINPDFFVVADETKGPWQAHLPSMGKQALATLPQLSNPLSARSVLWAAAYQVHK